MFFENSKSDCSYLFYAFLFFVGSKKNPKITETKLSSHNLCYNSFHCSDPKIESYLFKLWVSKFPNSAGVDSGCSEASISWWKWLWKSVQCVWCVLKLLQHSLWGILFYFRLFFFLEGKAETYYESSWRRMLMSSCLCLTSNLYSCMFYLFVIGVSLWMPGWIWGTPATVGVCVCEGVHISSVLAQQSRCYPINSVAAGHASATQRTRGSSRAHWSHFHSAILLLLSHCCIKYE